MATMTAFWKGGGLPRGETHLGIIGEENPNHPGTYRFSSMSGHDVGDAYILSPDGDINGNGQDFKPRAGSPCVATFSNDGAQCFILGFARMPRINSDPSQIPSVGNADENTIGGDKVWKTEGGATLILKRGGAVIIQGGAGTSIVMNPQDNTASFRATNSTFISDGYLAERGRSEIGSTKPQTLARERFQNQVGTGYDRVELQHGQVSTTVRRQLTISSVSVAGTTIKTKETYLADGTWIGEGPVYKFGGASASEPMVLGNQLVAAFKELIGIIRGLKVNTAWGPSTPPLPTTQLKLNTMERELAGKILATYLFLTKDAAKLG